MMWKTRRAALIAVAFLIAVGGAEIGLRAFLGLGHPPLSYADPDYGYAFKPNQNLRRFGRRVFYNEHGLRSEPLPKSKPPGELRVLCIGDSVTNGGALTDQSDTYPYLLEEKLRRAGLRARALNASAGSWGVENELAWMRKRGLFESDVVVLQVGTHDLGQRKSSGDKVGQDPSLPDKAPLLAIWELIERYGLPRLRASVTARPEFAAPAEEDHRICLRVIREMIEYVRANGAAPVVLLTPNREELENPTRWERWRANLKGLIAETSVPLVDMLSEFRAQPDRGISCFRDDVHPNERGNRLIARAVAKRILALQQGRRSPERHPEKTGSMPYEVSDLRFTDCPLVPQSPFRSELLR